MGKNLQKVFFGEFATFLLKEAKGKESATFLLKEAKGKERNSISF
jgi:hypothetical protein